ncbi:RNI-like protein [Panus rudis PR-1116 ss-1]|nr:RNI-like protein [Panus rudis PR-1116 ss-1]
MASPAPSPCFHQQTEEDSSLMQETQIAETDVKGKGISHSSEPMPIIPRSMLALEPDLFSMSFDSPASSSGLSGSILPIDFYSPQMDNFHSDVVVSASIDDEQDFIASSSSGKGKARELPPSLPPLSFSSAEFSYGSSNWPSEAGPSSYGSNCSSAVAGSPESGTSEPSPSAGVLNSPPSSPAVDQGTSSETSSPAPSSGNDGNSRVPSRVRSLSNISMRSRKSFSNLSISKTKLRAVNSGTFAKKLFNRKRDSPPSSPLSDFSAPEPELPRTDSIDEGSNLLLRLTGPRTPVATPVVETDVVWGTINPTFRTPRPNEGTPIRTKGRSYSSPLPLPSNVFDIVPLAPADIFSSEPEIQPTPDYFDDYLPHELKLHIFAVLVDLFKVEHERRIDHGKWSANKAGSLRNKWVGRDKGLRELFKLSRVSKCWQELVFDGQLWAKLDLRSFPKLPPSLLGRLCKTAGAFVKDLNLQGHNELLPSTLLELTIDLCVPIVPDPEEPISPLLQYTQLTSINLQGCTSLTTHSLHKLLFRSPFLQHLCLKGLTIVTNTTCDVLSMYCPRLVTLDLSRCPNMSGEGVYRVALAAVDREESMLLKELRLGGLKRVSDNMMAALGRAAPFLEVLDLSGARDLHNSAIEAFVACSEEDQGKTEVVQLTSREVGRDPTDYSTRYWRRVTRLRHLSLSSCILLTDHACSHLAHAVPKLEFLELASIGPEMRDGGLVRLLKTTPHIRRLDLEDATEVSDDLLVALTPDPTPTAPLIPSRTPPPPQPGHALEYLTLSYANVNNDALMSLVQNCTRLKVLEADNTRISGLVLREFVNLARERQMTNARIVAMDCRGVGEYVVKELTPHTRPRLGWRSWHARKLAYLDARDEDHHNGHSRSGRNKDKSERLLNVGQDECDEKRVVVKTFWSWQTVDAVHALREKRRKAASSASSSRRGMNASSGSGSSSSSDEVVFSSTGRARWWSPSGRRSSGPNTPTLLDANGDREGCTIM